MGAIIVQEPAPFYCKNKSFSESESTWIDHEIAELVDTGAVRINRYLCHQFLWFLRKKRKSSV
jgi:hypothetical protein